jgi:hypothetical protein
MIFRLVETVAQWRALVDLIMNFEVLYNGRLLILTAVCISDFQERLCSFDFVN